MRGALQAKSVRLPPSFPSIRWSSLITRLRQKRRERAIHQLEQIERFQREHARRSSLGQCGPDATRQWIRRF
jgi:hypothetical protein